MRKKLFLLLLTIVCCVCLALGISACGGTGSNSSDSGNTNQSQTDNTDGSSSDNTGDSSNNSSGDEEDTTPSVVTYTVTYDANGGTFADGSDTYTQTVNSGSTLTAPTSPTRESCTFAGWTTSKNGSAMWSFSSDTVTANITLYASWNEKTASILSVDNASIDGENIFMFVDSSDSLSLSSMVTCSSDSTWKMYYDELGQTEIPTRKTGALSDGDNYFYIVVTSTDSTVVNSYVLDIYVSYAVNVKYYSDFPSHIYLISSLPLKTVTTYTGYTFDADYIPSITGYTFNYWAYSDGTAFTAKTLWTDLGLYADKTANNYTVTYDVNGGDELTETTAIVTYDSGYTLTVPTRANYTFIGWYLDNTQLTNNEGTSLSAWNYSSDKTLTAMWTPNNYTVTLNCSDSSAGTVSGNGSHSYTSSVTIKATTNDGYTFVGWYNGETLLTTELTYTFTMPAESVTYTAKWSYYTLTTSVNDSEAGTATSFSGEKITAGEIVTLTASTNNGYTWLGWYNGETLLTTELSYTFTMPTEDIAYTAKWTYYTLTTSVNDSEAGTSTSYSDEKITAGELVTLTAVTNDGYTFLGWYNGETLLTAELSYTFTMPSESVIYTAKWTYYTLTVSGTDGGAVTMSVTSATVSFNLNGGSGSIASQTVTETTGLVYPEIPTYSGYVFRGWFTDSACTTVYDFTAEVTSDITLYAGWQAMATSYYAENIIDVTSNYNSSSSAYSFSTSGTSSSAYRYTYFTAYTSGTYYVYYKNSSTSSNYGTYIYIYNATQGTTIKSNSKITSTSYASISFTANEGDVIYIRNYRYSTSYSATFYLYVTGGSLPEDGGLFNNGIKNDGNKITTGESITVTATTNSGYTWIGWYDADDKLVTTELNYTFEMPAKDVTFTAKWAYYTLTTTTNDNDAGAVTEYSETKITAGNTVTVTATTNSGYTWLGWYDGETLLSTDLSYTFTMPYESVTYTAKWSKVTVTANNVLAGSVTSLDSTYKVGDEVTIEATTNTGYIWVGWYNGETLLSSKLSYTFTMPEENVIYTAKWSKITITTNYSEAGSVTSLTETYIIGDTVEVTASDANLGYYWVGWYVGNTLYTTEYNFNYTMTEENITYTAEYGIDSEMTTFTFTSTTSTCLITGIIDNTATEIVVPDYVTSIGSGVFSGCSSLVSITLPFVGSSASETSASSSTLFGYIFGTTSYTGGISTMQYYSSGSHTIFYIPATLTTIKITGDNILYGAFYNCTSLESVTIGDSVTSIGEKAFYNCTSLESVTIGDSVTSIGEKAFYNCTSLTYVTIGDSVEAIGSLAFYNCYKLVEAYNLSSLEITAGSTNNGYVGYYAKNVYTSKSGSSYFTMQDDYTFYNDDGTYYLMGYAGSKTELTLSTLTINGEKVSYSIYQYAFYKNTKITSVIIPDSVTSIEQNAFYGCSSLESINISDGVTSIGSLAFAYCLALTSVTIGGGVTFIDNDAFYNCSSIISITIPDSVTSIGRTAFFGCYKLVEVYNLSSLTITAGSSSYGGVGYYAKNVYTSKSGSSNLFIQGDYIFYNDNETYYLMGYTGSKTELTLPTLMVNSETISYSIYDYAFYSNAKITSLTIPNGITSIGYYAFDNCTSLTSVTFENTSGWYVTKTSGATSGTDVDVTDISTNATYLTSTYYNYYWYRSES